MSEIEADEKVVFRRFTIAILETVNESPEGAPVGILYLAVIESFPKITAQSFGMFVDQLARLKLVERRGDLLFPVKKLVT